MSFEDYGIAMYTIQKILNNQDLPLDHRMKYVDIISQLDLTKDESDILCEYIDGVNTDFNILCNRFRNNVKKAVLVE